MRLLPGYDNEESQYLRKAITPPMRLVRAIVAIAVALSLAILPLGASAAGHISTNEMKAAMQMADHADMTMDDCCPHDMDGKTSTKDGYKCQMGFCCIGGALALGEVRPVSFGC